MENALTILPVFIPQLPVIAVWSLGIVVSLVLWRRHARVSMLTLIACIGFLILSVVNAVLTVTIPRLAGDGSLNISDMAGIFGVISITTGFLHAILWTLLLIAIFGWRKTLNIPDS
ncbi:MAG: hypothetical protein RMJ54_18545 [Roseiflexaceae bacterium]|nr:hypothetical protein [Roseiflexus sp.]MDW8234775.1 hypothetical protein [Roseiflexaceae bacterium]